MLAPLRVSECSRRKAWSSAPEHSAAKDEEAQSKVQEDGWDGEQETKEDTEDSALVHHGASSYTWLETDSLSLEQVNVHHELLSRAMFTLVHHELHRDPAGFV